MARWKLKLLFASLIFIVLFTCVHYLLTGPVPPLKDLNAPIPNVYNSPLKGDSVTIETLSSDGNESCVMPRLDLYNPIYDQHKSGKKPVIQCRLEEDWLYYNNGSLHFNQNAVAKYDNGMKCLITYMQRVDDFRQRRGKTVSMDSVNRRTLELASDFVWADCRTIARGILDPTYKWSSLMAGISPRSDIMSRVPEVDPNSKPPYNILVFGFDSVSRLNFMRRLPKLYRLLTEELDAQVLLKYNIVGDGTTAALLGMLSGEYEEKLPETRRGRSKTHVDVYPWVWPEFVKEGYVTAYAEDESSIGTFQYRLNGFKKQPTDHFMRPFQMQAESEHSKHPTYCLGSTPKINILMKWLEDVLVVYPKQLGKFIFGFHSEYSHGVIEELVLADDPVTEWITHLKKSGLLNNTILMVMSDHGHRFSFTRSTLQGKYEERLPFFSVAVPPRFKQEFPDAYRSLVRNGRHRLTSTFDVHATFKMVLDVINKGQAPPLVHPKLSRGMSLFSEIPSSRSCEDAEISAHWCACNSWIKVKPDEDKIAQRAAEAVINTMNALIAESHKEGVCSFLELDEIKRAQKTMPKKEMLAFKESSDHDGRVPDLSASTGIKNVIYDLQLQTKPGGGLFEATAKYSLSTDKFVVNWKEISRVNKYGMAAHCVSDTFPHLAKFCYCKERSKAGEDSYMNKVIIG